jgi:hypothetical protein
LLSINFKKVSSTSVPCMCTGIFHFGEHNGNSALHVLRAKAGALFLLLPGC